MKEDLRMPTPVTLRGVLFGLIVLGFLSPALSVFAVSRTQLTVQPLNDFVLEPGKAEVFVNPGETVTRYISVTSRIAEESNFQIVIEDFKGSDDPNAPVVLLGNERGPYSLKDFLNPEIDAFSLKLGEKITIPVELSIPADTPPGGYYGAVIVSNTNRDLTEGQSADAQGQTQVISRVGVLFLVRVNGEVTEAGSLEDFKLLGPESSFRQSPPTGFEVLFRNSGNVHLVPHGKITVTNLIGTIVDSLPVDAYFALPDALRYREVPWDSPRFMLGRYVAELEFYKGYGDDIESRTISFWVLPLRIVIPVLIGIFLLALLIYYVGRRFELKKR